MFRMKRTSIRGSVNDGCDGNSENNISEVDLACFLRFSLSCETNEDSDINLFNLLLLQSRFEKLL